MALKDVAPVLAREFVIVMLDFDRQPGAKEVEKRYVEKDQGLPWFAFTDGDGKLLIASSDEPTHGNVGHPFQPYEVEFYKTMLQKVKKHLTDAEIDALITSLIEQNKKTG
jgi:hypothetical protein